MKKICKSCQQQRAFLDKFGICILCRKGRGGIEKTHTPLFINSKTRKSVDLKIHESKLKVEKMEKSKIFLK